MKKVFVLRLVKILSLLLAVLLVVSLAQTWLFKVRERDVQRMEGFRLEAKDSLDLILMGDSEIYTGFSSAYAYELEEFTSYPFAIAACPVTYWQTMLEDLLSRQSPQLIVVNISGVLYQEEERLHGNPALHYLLDGMPLSGVKIRALRQHSYQETDPAAYFLLPVLKYHSMCMKPEELEANFHDTKMLRDRGYALLKGVSSTPVCSSLLEGIRDVSDDDSELPLAEEAEQAMRSFLAYCRESDLNVLFVRFPHQIGSTDDWVYQNYQAGNRAIRIIREEGFPLLDLEKRQEEIGIDPNRDYYNRNHLNINGQKKTTAFLARYLVEECGVTPRLQTEENNAGWAASVQAYRTYYDYVKEEIDKQAQTPVTVAETAELISKLGLSDLRS